MARKKLVIIFGGTGFLGRYVTRKFTDEGYNVRVVTRSNDGDGFTSDYSEESIAQAVEGADVVVNLVGILFEKGAQRSFKKAHVETPKYIAEACSAQDVGYFINISALGIDRSISNYAASKIKGERVIFSTFPDAVILRPSIIFGAEDNFFNMFEKLSRYMPILPLIGGGRTAFQPVFEEDVAQAILNVTKLPKDQVLSRVYHIGGPDILTFKEVYLKIFKQTGRKRFLIPMPWMVAKIQACFMQMMPTPLLTIDQVNSLRSDNVIPKEGLKLNDLGVEPTPMDEVLPSYLGK